MDKINLFRLIHKLELNSKKLFLGFALLSSLLSYSQLALEGFETWPVGAGGWAIYKTGGINPSITWRQTTLGSSFEFPYSLSRAAYLERENVDVSKGYIVAQNWLITKRFTVPVDGQLRFYSRLTQGGDQGTRYDVRISTDANQMATGNYVTLIDSDGWGELEINPINQSQYYTEKNVSIPSIYLGQQVYIAFIMKNPELGVNGDRWFIDDVEVKSKCTIPTGLSATNLTTTSAYLAWSSTSIDNQWEIEIIQSGTAPVGSGIMINNPYYSASSITATGVPFEAGKSYRFMVRSFCNGFQSPWSNIMTFAVNDVGEICAEPIVVNSPLPYVATEQNLVGNGILNGNAGIACNAPTNYLNGYYSIYKYTPSASTTINITASGSENSIGVFVYDDCNSIGNTCLAGNVSSGTGISIDNLGVFSANDIYIVVVSPHNTNKYILTVSENKCTENISANFTVQDDCDPASPFYIKVNVSDLGSSSTVTATATTSENIVLPLQSLSVPGELLFGPIDYTATVQIVLKGNQSPNCIVTSNRLGKTGCHKNDECSNATVLLLNTATTCNYSRAIDQYANTSEIATTCPINTGDLWYEFVATSTTKIINIESREPYYSHAFYKGNDCGQLQQLYCSESNHSIATGLIVGAIYKIRIYNSAPIERRQTFSICITPINSGGCIDENPKSAEIKTLFKNLLNYLKDVTLTTGVSYTCPQLVLLAPYLTDANPKIYKNPAGGFSFSNVPSHTGVDVSVPVYDKYIAEIFPLSYSSPDNLLNVAILYTDGTVNQGQVKHINFCPPNSCKPVAGYIRVDPGMSCMAPGVASGFSFYTIATNITDYSWKIYNSAMQLVSTHSGASVNISIVNSGTYTLELTMTTSDNCKTKINKTIYVSQDCNSQCTEGNIKSELVKELYLDLINYLIATYCNSAVTISEPFNCPELAALAPYITTPNPLIHNLIYEDGNLSFSFDGKADPAVVIKVNGLVYDIDLFDYSTYEELKQYSTSYYNNYITNEHQIKSVDFCPSNLCPDIIANIRLNSGMSCATIGIPKIFSLNANTANLVDYLWTFYGLEGQVVATSTNTNGVFTYTNIGDYIVKLEVKMRDTECSYTFYKTITVNPETCLKGCTETSVESENIKNLYISLVNHVLNIFINGGSISSYSGPKLAALAPYITDSNPVVKNISYINGTLKFSFFNHGIASDVSIAANALISDINLINFYSADASTPYPAVLKNGQTTQIFTKHVNFCPPTQCTPIYGMIKLNTGLSCIPAGIPREFSLLTPSANIQSYAWTFFDKFGNVWKTSTDDSPEITYFQLGLHIVKLVIKDNTGCDSTFYKLITVNTSCEDSCTETNSKSLEAKTVYINLLNKLFAIYDAGLTVNDVDTSMELSFLAPFLTDPNPGIYNAIYEGNTLYFSFSQDHSQHDVVVKNNGKVADINLFEYESTDADTYTVLYTNGTTETSTVSHIDFCPYFPPCDSHVAFIIDESASIDEDEAKKIRSQLKAFINQQKDSGTLISLIGMSDSDNNTRTDHVSAKITTPNINSFIQWINRYRDGYTAQEKAKGISPNSDYWASGLKYIMDPQRFPVKPEIIIVITDGSQTKNIQGLRNIVKSIADPASGTHLYVYGLDKGSYADGSINLGNANNPGFVNQVSSSLMTSLKYLLELPQTEFPASSKDNLLAGVYYAYEDFTEINKDNNRFFSNELDDSHIGCTSEAIREYCEECETFQPAPGGKYWISAWVKEEQNIQVKEYSNAKIKLVFENEEESEIPNSAICFSPKGEIIDGWQRIAGEFTINSLTRIMRIELENLSVNIPVYFDDIRIHPINGSMKSFVYDPETFRLMAELDDNNYSTFYEYDKEGGLIRIKKETSRGIKTIQESRSGTVIKSLGNE